MNQRFPVETVTLKGVAMSPPAQEESELCVATSAASWWEREAVFAHVCIVKGLIGLSLCHRLRRPELAAEFLLCCNTNCNTQHNSPASML